MLSGFTHRCRNLLNGMKMSLYFVRREANGPLPRPLTEVEQTYGSIEQLFDQLQQIYRPMTLTPVRADFGSLVGDRERGWREAFARGGAVLDIVPPLERGSWRVRSLLSEPGARRLRILASGVDRDQRDWRD